MSLRPRPRTYRVVPPPGRPSRLDEKERKYSIIVERAYGVILASVLLLIISGVYYFYGDYIFKSSHQNIIISFVCFLISFLIIGIIVIIYLIRSINHSIEDYNRSLLSLPIHAPEEYEDDIQLPLPDSYTQIEDDDLTAAPVRRSSKIERIILEKIQKFLNIPIISFHFVNNAEIKSSYDIYFYGPIIESQTLEITGETNKDIRGKLQIVEGGISGKKGSRSVSNIKIPDLSPNAMLLLYQKEIIKKGQVTLGIEEVDIELTELSDFESTVGYLKARYEVEIPETTFSERTARLKDKAAQKTLDKLEQATGLVLIEGKFKVELDGDYYKCVYTHPVNEYLSNQAVPITISVRVPIASLEEGVKGDYADSIGKSIPLTIYGRVWRPINRQEQSWDLRLTPLAIY